MTNSYHQHHVIETLNAYLNYHNVPASYRLNTNGICSGLSTLYAKAVLLNQQEEFMEMLQYLSKRQPNSEMDIRVNQFIFEVLKLASPELFTVETGQSSITQTITLEGKDIQTLFKLGLVTTAENWEAIFSEIKLENGEAMLVRSVDHCVSISRNSNGHYRLYDPNYDCGVKEIKSEVDLITELCRCFDYETTNIGLAIQILKNSEWPYRKTPDVEVLYQKHLNESEVIKATSSKKSRDTLFFAATLADEKAMLYLLNLDIKFDINYAANKLVIENKNELLKTLLPKVDITQIIVLFLLSAGLGREDSFNTILDFLDLNESILKPKTKQRLLWGTAHSNNETLFKRILQSYDSEETNSQASFSVSNDDMLDTSKTVSEAKHQNTSLINAIFTPDSEGNDVVQHTIKAMYSSCLNLLLDTLNENEYKLSTEQQLKYLSFAIEQNNPAMVETLIGLNNQRMSPEQLSALSIPFPMMQKLNLELLNTLQKSGVRFSTIEQAIIAKKEHQPITILLKCGIYLIDFAYWFKEFFCKNSLNFKIKYQELKISPKETPPSQLDLKS